MTVEDIASALYSEQPLQTLYHYTSIAGLLRIVPEGRLRATDVHYLSDAAEMRRTADLLRWAVTSAGPGDDFTGPLRAEFLKWLDNRLTELGHMIFVGCFTASGNLLSQWRGYCEPGKGVSLGLAADKLARTVSDQSWQIGKCIYNERRQTEIAISILQSVEELGRQQLAVLTPNALQQFFAGIEGALLRIAALLKHPKFIEEDEWRVVSPVVANYIDAPIEYREGPSTLTPSLEFRLPFAPDRRIDFEHIWVGPTPHVSSALMAINSFLSRHRSAPRKGVGWCGIPYRTW